MCGILLHVTTKQTESLKTHPHWWDETFDVIKKRGPDSCSHKVLIESEDGLSLRLGCSVLALRGDNIVSQPLQSEVAERYVLLWNGEVFHSTLPDFDLDKHDGEQILSYIIKTIKISNDNREENFSNAFASILSSIEGPYAAVLIDTISGSFCFARDPIGRRSLLISKEGGELILTSAASTSLLQSNLNLEEVDCKSIWQASIMKSSTNNSEPQLLLQEIPRQQDYNVTLRELRPDSRTNEADLPLNDAIIEKFKDVISESVRQRVQHLRYHGPSSTSQIGILFSGGLDCCTLALLVDHHLPQHQPIDLLNVAFQNPRVLAAAGGEKQKGPHRDPYDVPDRLTGKQSLQELQKVAPDRKWNFVEVNVPYDEYMLGRSMVEMLMSPCTSVMDLSIASALFFASKAQSGTGISNAKVLLSGLGADELLGGYSRHRKAWQSTGQQGLVDELQMDLDRLPTRNLGRDDRIISHNGKESRYPFLDHDVISFLADLPVSVKMNLSLDPGIGDKMLLRALAKRLGLHQTSCLVKRAIQFGARSAKMEIGDGRIKGHQKLPPSNLYDISTT